jgi:hypothetical protein
MPWKSPVYIRLPEGLENLHEASGPILFMVVISRPFIVFSSELWQPVAVLCEPNHSSADTDQPSLPFVNLASQLPERSGSPSGLGITSETTLNVHT